LPLDRTTRKKLLPKATLTPPEGGFTPYPRPWAYAAEQGLRDVGANARSLGEGVLEALNQLPPGPDQPASDAAALAAALKAGAAGAKMLPAAIMQITGGMPRAKLLKIFAELNQIPAKAMAAEIGEGHRYQMQPTTQPIGRRGGIYFAPGSAQSNSPLAQKMREMYGGRMSGFLGEGGPHRIDLLHAAKKPLYVHEGEGTGLSHAVLGHYGKQAVLARPSVPVYKLFHALGIQPHEVDEIFQPPWEKVSGSWGGHMRLQDRLAAELARAHGHDMIYFGDPSSYSEESDFLGHPEPEAMSLQDWQTLPK